MDEPTFRALAAYKPKLPGADYPVLIVSTAYRGGKYSTDVCFVKGGNVDWAMFELVRNGAGTTTASDWVPYEEYPDVHGALKFMATAQQAFHTTEHQVVRGNPLYLKIYNQVCPEGFLAKPSGPCRKG